MTSPVWFLMASAMAALAVVATWRSNWRPAGLWFAVATIGQGVALQLVEAGPNLRYQHYPPLATIVVQHPWLFAAVVIQAVVVAAALKRRIAKLPSIKPRLPTGRLALAVLLSAIGAATVSPEVSRYLGELAFAASLQVLAVATVTVMVTSLPAAAVRHAGATLATLFGTESPVQERGGPDRPSRFALVAAVVATIIAASLSWFSYERHPHVPDEVVYLYHAKYFASGVLTMPPPPVPEAFDVDLLYYEPTRWFSPVPPGWPALLAAGVLVGAPWLINPVLGGLCVLLASILLGRLYDQRIARYGTFLLALSPWFLFLSMSFMTHVATLVFALAAALGLVYARDTRSAWWGLLSGAAVGATVLIRPLDGVIVGALIALWAIGVGGTRLRARALAGLAIGTLLLSSLTLAYNFFLTGDPLTFPINLYNNAYHGENSNAYGFGSDRGMGWAIDPNPGHDPVDALINSDLNLFGLNTDLFGWSTGSLVFIAALFCLGPIRRVDGRMLTAVGAVYLAHFFYYFSGGPDFGARYWFLMIVPLAALTAAGIRRVETFAGPRVGLAVIALTAMTLLTFVPWRATDKYYQFRGMHSAIREVAAVVEAEGDLVLIRGQRSPDYASAVVLNPADLTSSATVFAWDRGPRVRKDILEAYSDRRVWLVDGPTVTDGTYRIASGPWTAEQLLSQERHR